VRHPKISTTIRLDLVWSAIVANTNLGVTGRKSEGGDDPENDLVWGGLNISRELNRTLPQFYNLYESGALSGVVAKLGHKTFVASRRGLRNLPFTKGVAQIKGTATGAAPPAVSRTGDAVKQRRATRALPPRTPSGIS
jgi:hypothetical protein